MLTSEQAGNAAPNNVTSGDFTITVVGTYACGSAIQPFVLDSTLGITAGRWVLLRATTISGYVGATVNASATGLTVYSISQEPVNFAGTTYQCIVVALV